MEILNVDVLKVIFKCVYDLKLIHNCLTLNTFLSEICIKVCYDYYKDTQILNNRLCL